MRTQLAQHNYLAVPRLTPKAFLLDNCSWPLEAQQLRAVWQASRAQLLNLVLCLCQPAPAQQQAGHLNLQQLAGDVT